MFAYYLIQLFGTLNNNTFPSFKTLKVKTFIYIYKFAKFNLFIQNLEPIVTSVKNALRFILLVLLPSLPDYRRLIT
jgi:hypothetical protein